MSQPNTFLSGENTNYIIQQIITSLSKYGKDINIKDLQNKIVNFMNKVYEQYPNSDVQKLNHFVISQCTEKYLETQPINSGGTRKTNNIESQLEREIMDRAYSNNRPQTIPEQPDFTKPVNTQGGNGMSLNHAIGNPDTAGQNQSQTQSQIQPPQPIMSNDVIPVPTTAPTEQTEPTRQIRSSANPPTTYSSKSSYKKIILSLNKHDLVSVSDNVFTFSWNKKVVSDFSNNFELQLKYVTLPKSLPYLLAKYSGADESNSHVYSATGKNYSAKLIPCHTTDEHTTYKTLGDGSVSYKNLPSTLAFHLFSPSNDLNLNTIIVQKASKHGSQIRIITKQPHNLSDQDSLTLEFPQHFTCYKVTNTRVINDREILFDSPFVGYFSSDFRLLRNNWNLDITLSCQYMSD